MQQSLIFEKISKISLYILVFLIPLWFLPVTQNILDYQKQALLFILVTVSVIFWLAKIIKTKEAVIRLNFLYIPILIFLLASLLSAIFSIWTYVSFFGWPLNISDGFINTLFFVILFLLMTNILKDYKDLFWLLLSFIASFSLAVLYAILQMYQVFVLPISFSKIYSFNTLGTINSVAILSAILLPFCLIMAFAFNKWLRWLLLFFSALFFIAILLVNFFYAWLCLVAGLFVMIIFGIWNLNRKDVNKWIYTAIVLSMISLFFMFFGFSVPSLIKFPPEISPSANTEINLISKVLEKSPILGTGPATFALDYSRYREASLNQNFFWGARFNSGASEILDKFITTGVLGGVLFLSILLLAVILSLNNVLKNKVDDFSWLLRLAFLSSLLALIVAQIFYYSNFTISFLLWILLAGTSIIITKKIKNISLVSKSAISVGWFSLFLFVLIFGAGFLFVYGQKYTAEVQYLSGVRLISQGDYSRGIESIISSTDLNPSMDLYWRDLAQFYISMMDQVNADGKLNENQRKEQSQFLISNAIASANKAIQLGPMNVENWNVRGYVYRNLIGVDGADELAIDSYSKTIELEPASPFGWTELARVYLLIAQSLKENDFGRYKEYLNKSSDNLNKALEIYPDYYPARYLIALTYQEQGNTSKAIKEFEKLVELNPDDIQIKTMLDNLRAGRPTFEGLETNSPI